MTTRGRQQITLRERCLEVVAGGLYWAAVVKGLPALPEDLRRALVDYLRRRDRLTANSLAHLLQPTHLRSTWEELDLSGCTKLAPKGIKVLQDLPNLTSLNLSDTTLPPSAIKEVAALPKLKHLCLNNLPWVEDTCLGQLINLTSLESLSIAMCSYSPNGLKSVSHLTNLRSLNLCQTSKYSVHRRPSQPPGLRFRDSSLCFLTCLTNLETLNVAGMGVDGSFLANFNPSVLRDLTFSLLRGDDLPNAMLAKLTGLTRLAIRECPAVVLSPLPWRSLSRLVDLRLPTVAFAASAFVELLDHLSLLRHLSVTSSVLLLRNVDSDEAAIECYDDDGAFPPDLVSVTFHHISPPAHRLTLHSGSRPRAKHDPKAVRGGESAPVSFRCDDLTVATLDRLGELLSSSAPKLTVLKFKGACTPALASFIRASGLVQLRSLHALRCGSQDLLSSP